MYRFVHPIGKFLFLSRRCEFLLLDESGVASMFCSFGGPLGFYIACYGTCT